MFSSRLFQTAALIAWLALLPPDLFGAARLKLLLDSPTLTASEKFVLAQVLAGKPADLGQFGDETNRVLRAAFVEALLTQSGTNAHRNGIVIEHAVILEVLDLRNAEVPCETSFIECRFDGAADFSKSALEKGFSLTGSSFERSVNFSSMKIGRAAVFDRASFGAEVNATQMEVGGVFTAREARFHSPTGLVDFTSLKTGGDAAFTRATFAGPVTFQSAYIAENWRLDGSLFTHTNALVKFEEVKVGATTTFVGARFAGYVSFKDARFAALDLSKVT